MAVGLVCVEGGPLRRTTGWDGMGCQMGGRLGGLFSGCTVCCRRSAVVVLLFFAVLLLYFCCGYAVAILVWLFCCDTFLLRHFCCGSSATIWHHVALELESLVAGVMMGIDWIALQGFGDLPHMLLGFAARHCSGVGGTLHTVHILDIVQILDIADCCL